MSSSTQNSREPAVDEGTPLLNENTTRFKDVIKRTSSGEQREGEVDEERAQPVQKDKLLVSAIIPFLLIGAFISNADGMIIIASYGKISSEFGNFKDAIFLITGFTLSMCAAQPLYGKLSDIFGRRYLLLFAYTSFNIGLIVCALGQNLETVIAGRVISGLGGAGMTSLVSIIIADLVPLKDLATWRSYINIASTTGRSAGGPIGGWLADSIGWRWAFLIQVPPMLLASILVFWKVKEPNYITNGLGQLSLRDKIKRIDFVGAISLTTFILVLCLALDLGGQRYAWRSPIIISLSGASVALLIVFLLVERYYAKEPIFDINLLALRDVYTSYLIIALQMASQISIMFMVPLYFQVTNKATTSEAGLHLVPAVVGNAIGGLLIGYLIQKFGHYKYLSALGCLSSVVAGALLVGRWNGNTHWLESFYIFFGGFGNGVAYSAAFVALTAGIKPEDQAVATGGFYLCLYLGMILGVSLNSSVQHTTLIKRLRQDFAHIPHKDRIIQNLLDDLYYVKTAPEWIRNIAVASYVYSIKFSNALSSIEAAIALIFALIVIEKSLNRSN